MYTFQAIQIFIFLIPGFVASKLLDTLSLRRHDQNELAKISEALIFSMLIYTLYSLGRLKSPITLDQSNNIVSYNYDSHSFLILFSISMLVPLFLSFIINNDLHMRLARALRITKRTSRLSVWQDVFYEKRPLVIIDFVDGKRVFGWAEHYSDDPDKPFIYLAQPQWVDGEKYIPTGIEGMLITPEQKISFIEFLKDENGNETTNQKLTSKKEQKNGKKR